MAARLTAHAPEFHLESLTTRPLVWILAGIVAVIAVSLTLASLADVGPMAFFSENGPVENLQAGFYGVAALCFGWAAWSSSARLHCLAFAGFGLFVAGLMLREFDFTHSDTPLWALLLNSRGTLAVMVLAFLAFAAMSWRDPLGLLAAGLRWVGGRGGRPLLVAAALLLLGSIFDHHYLPVGRTVDLIGEEVLELIAAGLVLLSAAAAVRVSRSVTPA